MSSTCYTLSDDWGWYIDTENMEPIYQINPSLLTKKYNHCYNKLDTIEECEFDYYTNNQKDLDDLEDLIIYNNINNINIFNTLFSFDPMPIITYMLVGLYYIHHFINY